MCSNFKNFDDVLLRNFHINLNAEISRRSTIEGLLISKLSADDLKDLEKQVFDELDKRHKLIVQPELGSTVELKFDGKAIFVSGLHQIIHPEKYRIVWDVFSLHGDGHYDGIDSFVYRNKSDAEKSFKCRYDHVYSLKKRFNPR